MQPGEARFRPELDWEKPWRGQVFGAKMSETNGNKLDAREKWKKTEGAFGMESAPGEARFGAELDWVKPWRGQVFGAKMSETNGNKLDAREKWKKTVGGTCSGLRNERPVFFLGIQRERLAWKVQPGEARFGAELDWVKPWRGQVFGARLCTRNERKVLFFLGIQRERLAWKVQPGEARFRPEVDWEKPWRGQVFGAKMSETNGNKLDAREKWKKTVGGTCSGLRLAQEMREQFFF